MDGSEVSPEALLRLLPFDELCEEGQKARIALEEDRIHDAGRHIFKAVVSTMMDAGGAGLVAKLSKTLRVAARVCSFTEGTPVLMCDGSLKAVEQVAAGDLVLARDETTGEVACKEVVDPYANPDRSIILVELAHADGHVETIETTDNHPFFVADRGWTRVDELALGDLVPSADGSLLTVVGATWTDRVQVVYNFGVEGFHTYFVGEHGAWVHSCFNTPWAEMSKV